MTPELAALAAAALLQGVQFVLYSVAANLDVGPGYAMSARDRPPSRPISERTGRLQRALSNHFEGLVLFAIAVVLVTLSGGGTGFTAACAWVYVAARALYVPAYAFGWRPWRSVVWIAGFGATYAMILAALLAALLAPGPADAAGDRALRDGALRRTFHVHPMCIGCASDVHAPHRGSSLKEI